tara:strand:+ start:57 stop:290 length:234 start_codon:yes stop_codon:yes gene_type:complete
MMDYLISLQSLGSFVLISFALTFLACFAMYYKTKKKLKKYEKEFMKEFQKLTAIEKKEILDNSRIVRKIFSSYKQTI